MTRRFIVSTDPLTADEETKFAEAVKIAAYWHWLPNFWLLVDPTRTLNAESIRNAVKAINSTKRCLVLEVEAKTWAALTKPDAQGRDMGAWIKSTWDNS